MADNQSTMSDWSTPGTLEQLGSKLHKTREHLKKAIARIVALEEKDIMREERINQLELSFTLMTSKIEKLEHQAEGSDAEDSIDEQWKPTEEDNKKEEIPPPGKPSVHKQRSNDEPPAQRRPGGRSQLSPSPDESGSETDELQHGIRARVLDPSKIVHYRFDGKEKDYLQWSSLMVTYLESYDLWSYVSGERPRPPRPSDPEFTQRGVDSMNYDRYVH